MFIIHLKKKKLKKFIKRKKLYQLFSYVFSSYKIKIEKISQDPKVSHMFFKSIIHSSFLVPYVMPFSLTID